MKKPSIHEWAADCARLGHAAKRYEYANVGLGKRETKKALAKLDAALVEFAAKYAAPTDFALQVAYTMADQIQL